MIERQKRKTIRRNARSQLFQFSSLVKFQSVNFSKENPFLTVYVVIYSRRAGANAATIHQCNFRLVRSTHTCTAPRVAQSFLAEIFTPHMLKCEEHVTDGTIIRAIFSKRTFQQEDADTNRSRSRKKAQRFQRPCVANGAAVPNPIRRQISVRATERSSCTNRFPSNEKRFQGRNAAVKRLLRGGAGSCHELVGLRTTCPFRQPNANQTGIKLVLPCLGPRQNSWRLSSSSSTLHPGVSLFFKSDWKEYDKNWKTRSFARVSPDGAGQLGVCSRLGQRL